MALDDRREEAGCCPPATCIAGFLRIVPERANVARARRSRHASPPVADAAAKTTNARRGRTGARLAASSVAAAARCAMETAGRYSPAEPPPRRCRSVQRATGDVADDKASCLADGSHPTGGLRGCTSSGGGLTGLRAIYGVRD